jgi:branched-chain amino acid transport system substrate-binding protein
LTLAVCLLPAVACGAAPGPPPAALQKIALQRTVKVAVVSVFSGPSAALGRNVQNSLQVEADQLNAKGGVLGSRVEIVAADSEQNPAKAADLVKQQLADDDVKLLVGPNFTAGYLPVKGDIAQAGMPNCVTTVTDDALTGATFTFRSDAGERAAVTALFAYLHQSKPEIKRVGLLDDGDEAAQSYDRQFVQQAAHYGLAYAGHAGMATDSDPSAAIQKLVAQGADAVALSAQPAVAARMAQAVRQLAGNSKPLILGFDGLSGYAFPSQAGDIALNSAFASTTQTYLTDAPDSTWPAGYRRFVHNLTHQYGYAINGVDMNGNPTAADCLLQWSRAATKAGSFAGRDVVRAWENIDLDQSETVLGVRERLSAADHHSVSQSAVSIYQWVKEGNKYRLRQLPTAA